MADRGRALDPGCRDRRRLAHAVAHRRTLKALHRGAVREFNSDRKETHSGKRKLKRDE